MRTLLLAIVLSFMTLFFTSCDSNTKKAVVVESKDTSSEQSALLSKFTLTTTKGEMIDLEISKGTMFSKELNGKVVLINFWAPWCEPCIKEMPSFVELQEKYKDNFVILGILFDKKTSGEELAKFMKKYNMNFPVTVGEENFKIAKVFDDVKMIPESFLYSKDGIFIKKFIGEISKEKLEKYINEYK